VSAAGRLDGQPPGRRPVAATSRSSSSRGRARRRSALRAFDDYGTDGRAVRRHRTTSARSHSQPLSRATRSDGRRRLFIYSSGMNLQSGSIGSACSGTSNCDANRTAAGGLTSLGRLRPAGDFVPRHFGGPRRTLHRRPAGSGRSARNQAAAGGDARRGAERPSRRSPSSSRASARSRSWPRCAAAARASRRSTSPTSSTRTTRFWRRWRRSSTLEPWAGTTLLRPRCRTCSGVGFPRMLTCVSWTSFRQKY
jgi:hypothetical protein